MKILLPRTESLIISCSFLVTLNHSHDFNCLCADHTPIYVTNRSLSLLSTLYTQCFFVTVFFHLGWWQLHPSSCSGQHINIILYSSLSRFTSNWSRNFVDLTFQIYPKSGHFSPSSLPPSQSGWPSSFAWIINQLSQWLPSSTRALSCVPSAWIQSYPLKSNEGHFTPLLRTLQWLSISLTVKAKVLKIRHKAQHSLPIYHLLLLTSLSLSPPCLVSPSPSFTSSSCTVPVLLSMNSHTRSYPRALHWLGLCQEGSSLRWPHDPHPLQVLDQTSPSQWVPLDQPVPAIFFLYTMFLYLSISWFLKKIFHFSPLDYKPSSTEIFALFIIVSKSLAQCLAHGRLTNLCSISERRSIKHDIFTKNSFQFRIRYIFSSAYTDISLGSIYPDYIFSVSITLG